MYLNSNQLTTFPDEIGELKEQEWLDVTMKTENEDCTDEIGELKELVWLNVSNNKLTVFSSHTRHLNKLWVLLSSDNQLTILPDEIGELKALENAACGWKSCNIGRNEKRCENTEQDF